MENKMCKEHVAELLKQLEELKKKKAHKERKLQKLKDCGAISIKKKQASNRKSVDQQTIREVPPNDDNANLLISGIGSSKIFTSSKNDTHPFICPESVQTDNSEKEHCVYKETDLFRFENQLAGVIIKTVKRQKSSVFDIQNGDHNESPVPDVDKTSFKNCGSPLDDFVERDRFHQASLKRDYTQLEIHKKTDEEIFASKKHKSSVSDQYENSSCRNEKCQSFDEPVGIYVCDGEVVNNPICDVEKHGKCLESPVALGADTPSESISDHSSHKEQKSIHSSNSKSRSSDLLDDSLNINLSLLPINLFDNNNEDKKEVNNNNCAAVESAKNPAISENSVSKLVVRCKTSSANLWSKPFKKDNYIFNFPKFSTPTNSNFCLTDLQNLQSEVPEMSQPVGNVSIKIDGALNEVPKDSIPSDSKFSPSKIDSLLGKGLYSVLDAEFESPEKSASKYIASCSQAENSEASLKRRKICFPACSAAETRLKKQGEFESNPEYEEHSKIICGSSKSALDADKQITHDIVDFGTTVTFGSNSFSQSLNASDQAITFADNSDDVLSQVTKTVNDLVDKICVDYFGIRLVDIVEESVCLSVKNDDVDDAKPDSEIFIIPETEGLGFSFSKDSEEFFEMSTLSQNMKDINEEENLLNMSSQSKLELPVVKNIVTSVRLSKTFLNSELEYDENEKENFSISLNKSHKQEKNCERVSNDTISAFDNSLELDTSFLEEDTQTLGHFKQVPFTNQVNVPQEDIVSVESNLNFICSLYGAANEPVIDVEILLFSGAKYAFIQQSTQIHVWRQENQGWIKIFSHTIEDMLSLVQICVTMDDDSLVIVMLLSGEEKYCLQFLLFEKDTRIIKLMENTHWLEDSDFQGSILLCGLNGLMFATAQNKKNSEVSLHAFVSLKENPRLMTAVLGSTDTALYSLCKIDKLPNALMGISGCMLYVWHILEARLVTAVALHPEDYLPIKQCFWATVENGLIYFLTVCEGKENYQVCQLLAANLATGFCQSAMTYSSRPSNQKVTKIIKAAYLEPFLVVAHSSGAFIWSVLDEFCSAALSSKSNTTAVAISKDTENWGLLVVGSKSGYIDCYGIH